MANSLLDETGMVDTGGDGFRELPNGEKIRPSMRFANPGLPGVVVELAASGWAEVGVQTTVKEITPDECRSAPLVITLDANERWVPRRPLPISATGKACFGPSGWKVAAPPALSRPIMSSS